MTATLRQAAAIAKAAKPGRVAVIDVGSNSVRLVVYDKRSRSLVPIFNEKALPGLGKGLERTGKLNAEGRKEALINIRRFVALTRAMNVTDVEMLATAAVRDAKDKNVMSATFSWWSVIKYAQPGETPVVLQWKLTDGRVAQADLVMTTEWKLN